MLTSRSFSVVAGLAGCLALIVGKQALAQEDIPSPRDVSRPYLAPSPADRTWDLRDNRAEWQRSAYRGEFDTQVPYNQTRSYEPRAWGDFGYGAINDARLQAYRNYDDWAWRRPAGRQTMPNRQPIDYDDTHFRGQSWYNDTRDRRDVSDLDDDFPDPRPRAFQSYADHYERQSLMTHPSYLYPSRGVPYTHGMHWRTR